MLSTSFASAQQPRQITYKDGKVTPEDKNKMTVRYEPCRAYFEIELYSDQPFVGARAYYALYIGKRRFTRYYASDLRDMIFQLRPEEFAETKTGDEVSIVKYEGEGPPRYERPHGVWKFGHLDKSKLKLTPLQTLGSDDDIARIDVEKLRPNLSAVETPASDPTDAKLQPGVFYPKGYFVPGEDIQSGLREGIVGVCLPYVSVGRYLESPSDRRTKLFSTFGPCTGVYLWYVPQKNSFYLWGSCWNSAAIGPFMGDPNLSLVAARIPGKLRRTLPGAALTVESKRLMFADERQARVPFDPQLDCASGRRNEQENLKSFLTRFRLINDSSADFFYLADSPHSNRPFGFRILRPALDRGWDRATKPDGDNQQSKGVWRRLRRGSSVEFEVIDKGEYADHAFVVLLNARPNDKEQIELRAQYPIVYRPPQPERRRYQPPQQLQSEADKRAEVAKLRQLLAEDPYGPNAEYMRAALVNLLIQLNAPSREIVEATGARSCLPEPRWSMSGARSYHQLAELLASRGEYLDEALEYAKWSMGGAHIDGLGDLTFPFTITLASIYIKRGEFDEAIRTLKGFDRYGSLGATYLGLAYEKSGRIDEAIEAYIAAIAKPQYFNNLSFGNYGVPGGVIKAVAPPSNLKALYLKRYGTLDGLEARIEAARQTAWRAVHIDPYRVDSPSPQWTLPDIKGGTVSIGDLRGKIVVLCFLAVEDERAAQELMYWQDLSVKYKVNGVVFICLDASSLQPFDERQRSVAHVLEKLGITLPTVLDEDERVLKGYNSVTTSRVLLIDRKGVYRFDAGNIFHELSLPRAVELLDYLLKEQSQPQE
jgi:tetratricopeptide (TPR) repeat protein